ncbi:MAG: S8 family serine peptidase [Candidatus Lernaella stagnicola]|nr:S8 family serine peptidase [Candidatus Lernaella stagnicola]
MKQIVSWIALAMLLVAGVAHAAWIDPTLEEELAATPDNGTVRAYVMLRDRVDVRSLAAQLTTEQATFARRHYEVIAALQEKAAATQAPLLEAVAARQAAGEVAKLRAFWIDNALAVEATPAFFDWLAERPEVGRIYYDYPIELIRPVRESAGDPTGSKGVEFGIEFARAPELWALGIDGTGVIAADMDTGADGSHPAFATRWRGLVADPAECWYDPAQGTDFPYDSGRHGTHTLGTITGGDDGENQIGMAPGALWIAAAVVDVPGVSIYTEAVAAFEFFADPDGNPGTTDDVPAAINNSWGISNMPFGGCKDDFWAAIDTAEAAGVVVVFAAGNEGPFARTLRSPADRIETDFNVFSVGALRQNGQRIVGFSSRGPSRCDRATIKPEVVAVGEEVRSSIPGGEYSSMDGTSMASPHVTGAMCLLRQAYPDATVDELKMALYYSAVDMGDPGEDNDYGMGRIDLVAAYDFLMDLCDQDGDGYDKPDCGGDDCNDFDENIHPGATEVCNGIDDNCDDTVPDDEIDHDEDGVFECAGDCDPQDPDVHPGHQEICDGKDNNCDGDLPQDELDQDGDGLFYCNGDCMPFNEDVYTGAPELCDGLDNNCDENVPADELDVDEDGFAPCAGDCNDEDEAIHPDAEEICDDGVDNNCDELTDEEDPACQEVDDDDDNDDNDTVPVDDDDNNDAADDDATDDDDDDDDSGGCA